MALSFSQDKKVDAVYISLSEKPYAYTKRLDDMRYVDYASDKTPIGVELLGVSWGVNISGLPHGREIAEALEEKGIKVYTAV